MASRFPRPNGSGVFVCEDKYEVIGMTDGKAWARVKLLQIGASKWAWGYEYWLAECGGCSAPSTHAVCETRTACVVTAVSTLVTMLGPVATGLHWNLNKTTQRGAKRGIEALLGGISDAERAEVVAHVLKGRTHG